MKRQNEHQRYVHCPDDGLIYHIPTNRAYRYSSLKRVLEVWSGDTDTVYTLKGRSAEQVWRRLFMLAGLTRDGGTRSERDED